MLALVVIWGFPGGKGEYRDALLPDDGAHRRDGALVDGAADIAMGGRVRQGVNLELKTDLDDIKGGNAESISSQLVV